MFGNVKYSFYLSKKSASMYDYNEYYTFVVDNIDADLLDAELYDKITLSLDAFVNDLYHAGVAVDRANWLVTAFLMRFKKHING